MNSKEPAPLLSLVGVSKQFKEFNLNEISFTLNHGDYFILLGVSGAGKSMVLETIAGLIHPDQGSILMQGADITNEKIQKRKIGLVFQDHAVFPHLNVKDNIAYPLHHVKNAVEKRKVILDVATELGIENLLHRKPSTLSGGELQRVALARALVQKPEILLLDEPLASLDTRLKSGLRSLLRKLNRKGQTIIHVTHDYEEAVSLGNIIAVMHEGKILQTGHPEEVFSNPTSEFVAHFTHVKNFFKVTPGEHPNEVKIENGPLIRISGIADNQEGFILIRNEDIFISNTEVDTSAVNNFRGTIREIVPTIAGTELLIESEIPLYAVVTRESLQHLDLNEGKPCFLHFKASAVKFIPKG